MALVLPPSELPTTPTVERFNDLMVSGQDLPEFDPMVHSEWHEDQLAKINVGEIADQNKDCQSVAQISVAELDAGEISEDLIKDIDVLIASNQPIECEQPAIQPTMPGFNFDFEFPMNANAPAQAYPHIEPSYVPFVGQPATYIAQPQPQYPPPSMNPFDGPSSPFPTQQPTYPWTGTPYAPPLYTNNFANITPPGTQTSSLDASWLMYGSQARPYQPFPPPYPNADPESLALSVPPTPVKEKRRPEHNHGGGRRMSKKAKRATIKNYLDSQRAPSQESESSGITSPPHSPTAPTAHMYPGASPPPNTISIPVSVPVRGPRNSTKKTMDCMRASRRAYFQIPQSHTHSREASYSSALEDEEEEEEIFGRRTSLPKIQARRRNHPGRKISVKQTPEVIARNAARRERYRKTLDKRQREMYDMEHPGVVSVRDADTHERLRG